MLYTKQADGSVKSGPLSLQAVSVRRMCLIKAGADAVQARTLMLMDLKSRTDPAWSTTNPVTTSPA